MCSFPVFTGPQEHTQFFHAESVDSWGTRSQPEARFPYPVLLSGRFSGAPVAAGGTFPVGQGGSARSKLLRQVYYSTGALLPAAEPNPSTAPAACAPAGARSTARLRGHRTSPAQDWTWFMILPSADASPALTTSPPHPRHRPCTPGATAAALMAVILSLACAALWTAAGPVVAGPAGAAAAGMAVAAVPRTRSCSRLSINRRSAGCPATAVWTLRRHPETPCRSGRRDGPFHRPRGGPGGGHR